MINSIDAIYFKELAEQNPEDVCKRALCRYDDIKKCYDLSVWGDEYAIYPHELKIDRLSKRFQCPHEYLYVFIATFFRGPHEIPTNLISSRYSDTIDEFRKTCDQLDGIPLNMADAAYVFNITPRILVAVLYWDGDDEFPPESKILFDKSVTEHLALDIIFALAVDICTRIARPAD
ncbi:MAG: DUF3786 domain-containing protein [Deltaproteobacteria bacterium]|nr:DUF3786 domain-containing protein [Deltaproteobacteria bacterium]